jgi:hypothetical protein
VRFHSPLAGSPTRSRLARTGRAHVIISGMTVGACCSMPSLPLRNDGYPVFPVIDACGAWSTYEADAARSRTGRAGAELVTVFALGCELQANWKLPSGNATFVPFTNELPSTASSSRASGTTPTSTLSRIRSELSTNTQARSLIRPVKRTGGRQVSTHLAPASRQRSL